MTSTTRRGHASTRHKRPSIATTPGFGSAAPSTRSRTCDDRSKRSSCGVDGPAATPSTSSNSATPSQSSPATVAETITPTSSEHSAKRHTIGPTTPASTCRPRGDTPEPSNEPGSDSTCNRGQRALDPVAHDPQQEVRRTPGSPRTAGSPQTRAPRFASERTNLAWVVSRCRASARSRWLTRTAGEADGCGAEGLSTTFVTTNRRTAAATVQVHCIAPPHVAGSAAGAITMPLSFESPWDPGRLYSNSHDRGRRPRPSPSNGYTSPSPADPAPSFAHGITPHARLRTNRTTTTTTHATHARRTHDNQRPPDRDTKQPPKTDHPRLPKGPDPTLRAPLPSLLFHREAAGLKKGRGEAYVYRFMTSPPRTSMVRWRRAYEPQQHLLA